MSDKFHLFVCLAMLNHAKTRIVQEHFGFDEILSVGIPLAEDGD